MTTTKHDGHAALPYPRNRLLMVDGGRMGLRKHTVHGLVEFDITRARETIRQHRVQTGEALSFSAFLCATKSPTRLAVAMPPLLSFRERGVGMAPSAAVGFGEFGVSIGLGKGSLWDKM